MHCVAPGETDHDVHMSSQTLVQLVERVHVQAVCPPRRAAEAPGPVIGLYNAVLCHLAEVVSSQVGC